MVYINAILTEIRELMGPDQQRSLEKYYNGLDPKHASPNQLSYTSNHVNLMHMQIDRQCKA